jgi:hypothetical protein
MFSVEKPNKSLHINNFPRNIVINIVLQLTHLSLWLLTNDVLKRIQQKFRVCVILPKKCLTEISFDRKFISRKSSFDRKFISRESSFDQKLFH